MDRMLFIALIILVPAAASASDSDWRDWQIIYSRANVGSSTATDSDGGSTIRLQSYPRNATSGSVDRLSIQRNLEHVSFFLARKQVDGVEATVFEGACIGGCAGVIYEDVQLDIVGWIIGMEFGYSPMRWWRLVGQVGYQTYMLDASYQRRIHDTTGHVEKTVRDFTMQTGARMDISRKIGAEFMMNFDDPLFGNYASLGIYARF